MKPPKISITGPLAPYISGLRSYLHGQGYTPLSANNLARVMAHLSCWLRQRRLEPNALNARLVGQFLQYRRRAGYRHFLSGRGIEPVIDYLREEKVVPPLTQDGATSPRSELESVLAAYTKYLVQERALTPQTIRWYTRVASEFFDAHGNGDVSRLRSLTGRELSKFILKAVRNSNRASGGTVASALRAVLRYLFLSGIISIDLAKSVPAVAGSRVSLPKAVSPEAVKSLLWSCDRRTHDGRRSFAVILLMVRLGLRRGEVLAMELNDIQWRQGELIVRGKGRCVERLPLPEDIGQALASYIRYSRPKVTTRKVFVRHRAPHRSLSSSGITAIVYRACVRAKIPRVGTHRLRHTAATEMLRRGASLSEIAQVLRHRSVETTAIYAKVDHISLRTLVQPWPGGAR